MFHPTHTPYDRQNLIDYLVASARAKDRVRVLVGESCWMVQLRRGAEISQCSGCGHDLRGSCYSTDESGRRHCLGCAFGDQVASAEGKLELVGTHSR